MGTAFQFTMNWNPSYSYSTLPANYKYDSIPAHWKVMLNKVEPAEKGIPVFKNIYVSDITAKGVKKIVNAAGLPSSYLQNFNFDNIKISGTTAGDISYGEGWVFSKVNFTATDGKPLNVKNSKRTSLENN